MSNEPTKRGLGRGLSALMADTVPASPTEAPRSPDRILPIEAIEPNPDQPRRSFGEDALNELASSIREKGVIQPLIVRVSPRDPQKFEIVAGERRWRASQRAQLHELPVIVREFSDSEVLEVAIIENIQRADLNAIDEAAGYRQLMDRFGHTQENLANALGKSRSHIANMMRLLNLPDSVQNKVAEGVLSAGHVRTLVGNPEAEKLATMFVERGLSVREAEKFVKEASGAPKPKRKAAGSAEKDADTKLLESELSAQLGTKVSIDPDASQESGSLTIRYNNLDFLDDLLRKLSN